MKRISEKLTKYVIKAGVVSEELFEVYQYGFQIGLEILSCFTTCLMISIYLKVIPEFIIFTVSFMLLRTYGGGFHLNSFGACFVCSIFVQTAILLFNNKYQFSDESAWCIIIVSSIFICKLAPVENINRELDEVEKVHCKRMTMKIVVILLIFTAFCTFSRNNAIVSLIAITTFVVFISQCIGMLKYNMSRNSNGK